jgi:hypothetical protein
MEDWEWCEVCTRSVPPNDRKRHRFTGKHKRLLEVYVPKVVSAIGAVMEENVSEETAMHFICPLCPNSLPLSPPYRISLWTHLAQREPHGKNVDRFVVLASPLAASLPLHSRQLTLSPVTLQKRRMALLKEQSDAEGKLATVTAAPPPPPSAADRVTPAATTAIDHGIPPPVSVGSEGKAVARTLVSKQGILQNPTGSHNTVRVWGGGILRLPQQEWIHWELDEAPVQRGGAAEQISALDDDQQQHPNPSHPFHSPPPRKGATMTSLTRLERPLEYTAQGIPTVHSVPPTAASFSSTALWLQSPVTSTAAIRVPVGGTLHEMAESYRQKLKLAQKNPNRIGAAWANARLRQIHEAIQSQMPSSTAGRPAAVGPPTEEWLPSFGGVWNEGPRSQHKRAFKENQNSRGVGHNK